jgi:hypothetical protein
LKYHSEDKLLSTKIGRRGRSQFVVFNSVFLPGLWLKPRGLLSVPLVPSMASDVMMAVLLDSTIWHLNFQRDFLLAEREEIPMLCCQLPAILSLARPRTCLS